MRGPGVSAGDAAGGWVGQRLKGASKGTPTAWLVAVCQISQDRAERGAHSPVWVGVGPHMAAPAEVAGGAALLEGRVGKERRGHGLNCSSSTRWCGSGGAGEGV